METVKDITKSSHMESSGKMGGEEREKRHFKGGEMDGWMDVYKDKGRKITAKKLFKKKLEENVVNGCEGHEWINCLWT